MVETEHPLIFDVIRYMHNIVPHTGTVFGEGMKGTVKVRDGLCLVHSNDGNSKNIHFLPELVLEVGGLDM